MTNEQLKILIFNIVARLEDAISVADDNLDDVPRHKLKRYIGKALVPAFSAKNNSEDWEQYEGEVIALDPIKEIIVDLKKQADQLGGTLLEIQEST